ncbi:MAG: hypothetical protein CMO80_20930 [Verrucomicrobiales bacterium]|nr:hypothetical protein [Verrucomicrobiales bacterium]
MNAFEVYEHPNGELRAGSRGFNWIAFLFSGLWTLSQGLILTSALLIAAEALLVFLCVAVFSTVPAAFALSLLLLHFACGWAGNRWRTEHWQHRGFFFQGYVEADRAAHAVRNVKATRSVIQVHPPPGRLGILDRLPRGWRSVFAVADLTIKSAIRFRVVPFLFVAVLILIIGLPLVLKHDNTATGFMQIVVTYTLGSVVTILVFSTVWMTIGNLAREIEEGQIQLLTSKPIAHWRILLGKWIGIMAINLSLLVFVGVGIQFFIKWRGAQLPEKEQAVLNRDLLVARGVISEPSPDFAEIENQRYARFVDDNPDLEHDAFEVRDEFRKQAIAEYEAVPPHRVRTWVFEAGPALQAIQDGQATLRVKFQAGYNRRPKPFSTIWEVGPDAGTRQRLVTILTTDTPHFLPLENPTLDEQNRLAVHFHNLNAESFVFDAHEGVQLLYRDSGFGSNLVRAFVILYCWLGLAAAVGITAATKLNFNVAAFFALGLIGSSMFTGTIQNVVEQGSVWSYYEGELNTLQTLAGYVMYALIRFVHLFTGVISDYSPVEALGTGRVIPWSQLGAAFLHCWILFGSILAALGLFAFTRRELADPFNN